MSIRVRVPLSMVTSKLFLATQYSFITLTSIMVLMIFCVSSAQAETVQIVTYYGKTGGIFGDGKLNVVGNKINGRDVCPQVNTNANGTPGCDMSDDSGYQTNNPNDPTDDTYTGDLIVRTSDIFELYAGWAVNGTSDPVTLSSILPANKGLKWEQLPSSCKAGSSISADGLTITCIRSGYDKNGIGSYAEDLPFHVKVLANTQNGVQPGPLNFTITGPTTNDTDTTEAHSIIVTAAPKWNIQKTLYNVSEAQTYNGVTGYILRYLYYLEADEVVNEVDSASAVLGNEALGKNFTLEFDDDVSQLSTNAELFDCKISYSHSTDPFPSFNTTYPDRSIATPLADMTQTCTQSGGKGTTIHVTHTGIDASLEHVPTKNRGGGITPLTRSTIAIGNIEIFVPDSDVQGGDPRSVYNAGNDNGYLDTINTITSFDPVSISGQSNFGTATESTNDNTRNQRLYYYGPGYTGGNFYKYYLNDVDNVVPINTASGWSYGDGVLSPNREFATRVYMHNTGNTDFSDSILCDVIDKNVYDVIDIPGQEGQHAAKNYLTPTNLGITPVFEYATGYIGSWPPPIDDNNAAKVITECSDASITWHATTASARATGAITKVRMRLAGNAGIPGGNNTYMGMIINLKTRSTNLNGDLLPNGTNIVNYTAAHDTVLYATQPNNWYGAYRQLHSYPNPLSNGYKADRAVLTRAIVRIDETLDKAVVEPGDVVKATLTSTFTTDNPDGENGNVTITGFLDAGLKYVIGSGNIGDPAFGTCADLDDGTLKNGCTADDQILIWDLGTRTSNDAIENITFNISVGATAAAGTIHTYAQIKSPTDNSKIEVRTANKNMTITVPSALLISKEVNTPFRTINQSPIEFTTFIRNGASKNLTNLDVIDVLPFNGDGTFGVDFTVSTTTINHKRFQATAFDGSYEFLSADGGYSCTSGDNWFYSNTDPRQINLAPTANSNKAGGATTWCQGTKTGPAGSCGFSNADVTAIRLTGPALPGDASCSMNIKLKPTGNKKGNVYTNSSGAYANGVSLPVMSNDVSAFIPTTLFGDTVWIDANANGIQDKDEVGVEGIVLELLDENNAVLATTTTDKDGKYKFIDLIADKIYKVRATIESFYAFSPKAQGSDITKDSNINPATSVSDNIVLNFNQQNKTIDIGVTSSLTISGKAYKDDNLNSVFDNETGIPTVTLNLYKDVNKDGKLDADDILVSSTQTDANGDYTFTNVFSGDYVIEVDTSANIPATHLLNGSNPLVATVVDIDITGKNFPFIPKVQPYSAQGSCGVAGFIETFGAGIGRVALPASISTSYSYNDGTSATASDNLIQDGQYAVLDKSSIAAAGNEWIIGDDATGDAKGRLLMINADSNTGKYYQQSISGLTVGKTYTYSINIANAASQSGASKPDAKLSIESGGNELHSTTTGAINAGTGQLDWYKKELVFIATQANVELVLSNAAFSGNANNIVLDDIALAESCKDYGDAPTTGTSYGEASHAISTGLYLGAIPPDADNANQATADANGDDSNGGDDEDAISTFPKLTDLDIGLPYEISIKATNTLNSNANLIAWIDFDNNASFDADEASEITVVNAGTNNGNVKIKWNSVPADIKISESFARLRLTNQSISANDVTTYYLNGEVEDYPISIEIGGYPVQGRVYNDSNVDGISDDANEKGISDLPVVLVDIINNSCISTRTDAKGFYEFFPVVPGNYQLYEASRETVPVPQNCDIAKAKDPALYRSTTANVLDTFSVVDAKITGKNFGDVHPPSFNPNHSNTILAGNVVLYPHTFTAKSTGIVNFTTANSTAITSGWSSVIYQDNNCNGQLDTTEASAPISNNLATSAGTNICLINKVYAPQNIANGETFTNTISADFDFNNALAGTVTLNVIDTSKVAANDNQNPVKSSKLELRKTVQNITQNTAETETQNQAKPGEILKYRIYYSNTGTGAITDLEINDTAQEFTLLQTGTANCDNTPTGLNCSPIENDPDVEWRFTGTLEGGAKGSVSYQVIIE